MMKNVLIIKIGAIGDILMVTPALRSLKKSYPGIHLSLLIGKSVKEVVRGNSYVDELIEIDDHIFFNGTLRQRIKLLWGIREKIKTKKYDTCIIFHRDERYALFAFLCGIVERVGFKKDSWGDIFLTKGVKIKGVKHHIYHYLELLEQCGIVPDGNKMDFFVREKARQRAREILNIYNINKNRLIGISPGGARNAKEVMDIRRWPIEKYAELALLLEKDDFNVILFGSKTDINIVKKIPLGKKVVNATGKTSLEETAALMAMCKVVVTHDSGPMHLAGAVGTPVVAMFGSTDPREKHTLNNRSHYYWKKKGLQCAPCYQDGVFPLCDTIECMQRITPLEVFKKTVEIACAS